MSASSGGSLPTGVVTFVFTDIEGSTRLLQSLGDEGFHESLDLHNELLRRAVVGNGGLVVRTIGDAFFAVFTDPAGAVRAASDAQRSLQGTAWPGGQAIAVRIGMHTGRGVVGGDDYVGIDVHRAARIADAANGGQVLLSASTVDLVASQLEPDVSLRSLGPHRLRDLSEPEPLHQLDVEGLRSEFPPLRTMEAVAGNLPDQPTSFVGRSSEIAAVATLLDSSRVVTLTGPGGTGKTRLAIQVAAEGAHEFPDGAFFVPLETITDRELVPQAILEAMGAAGSSSTLDPATQLATHLSNRRALIVLDNVEQIPDLGPVVAQLVAAAPDVQLITTSRVPLHISGEQEYPVPPLSTGDGDLRHGSESMELFAERALAVRPDLELSGDTLETIAALTERLDGLPLAIELAASRVKSLAPDAILDRLSNRLLTSTATDVPERQQTITNAIGWSYDLLGDSQRRLFEDLSVFMGGATLELVEQVTDEHDDVLDGLASLVDHSLLRLAAGDGEPRYRMLVVIREFGCAALVARGDDEALRERHALAYLDLAREAEPHLLTGQAEWLDRLSADHENLRAAIDWAIESDRADVAWELVARLWRFWQIRGHLTEAGERIGRALALESGDLRLRALALEAYGGVLYWQGRWEASRAPYEEALELLRLHGSDLEVANALYNASFPIGFGGDRDRAHAYLEESRSLADTAGDLLGVGRALWGMGDQAQYVGDSETVIHYVEPAEGIFRELDAPYDLGWSRFMLAEAHYSLGHLTEARLYFTDGLRDFARVSDRSAMVLFLFLKAAILYEEGAIDDAARLLGAVDAIRERTGTRIADMGLPGYENVRALHRNPPTETAAALAAGQRMSFEEAVAFAEST